MSTSRIHIQPKKETPVQLSFECLIAGSKYLTPAETALEPFTEKEYRISFASFRMARHGGGVPLLRVPDSYSINQILPGSHVSGN